MDWKNFFANKGQFIQLIVSVIACSVAVVNVWPSIAPARLILPSSIVMLAAAVLIVVISVVLLFLYPRTSAGVQVNYPIDRAIARKEDGKRYFEVQGTLKQVPEGMEIWAFIRSVNQPRWWPHGPATVNPPNWTISVNPGSGKSVRLQVCLIGKDGQALIGYYGSVWEKLNEQKKAIAAQSPSVELDELGAPPFTQLTSDVVKVFDKVISVQ
jgi:hypothetical protein